METSVTNIIELFYWLWWLLIFAAIDFSDINLFEVSDNSVPGLESIVIKLVPRDADVTLLIFLINGSIPLLRYLSQNKSLYLTPR